MQKARSSFTKQIRAWKPRTRLFLSFNGNRDNMAYWETWRGIFFYSVPLHLTGARANAREECRVAAR